MINLERTYDLRFGVESVQTFDGSDPGVAQWLHHDDFIVGFMAYDKSTQRNRNRCAIVKIKGRNGRTAIGFTYVDIKNIAKCSPGKLDAFKEMRDWVLSNVRVETNYISDVLIFSGVKTINNKRLWLIVYSR